MFSTIRSKILVGFFALISLTVTFGLWTIVRVNEVGREAGRMISTTGEHVPEVVQLLVALERQEELLSQIELDSTRRRAVERFDSVSVTVNTILNAWSSKAGGVAAEQDRYTALRASFDKFYSHTATLRQGLAGLVDISPERARDVKDSISKSVIAIRTILSNSIGTRSDGEPRSGSVESDLASLLQRTIELVLWGAVAATILGLIGAFYYSRWVLRPIGRLSAAAQAVAGGRLEGQVPVTTNDELGDLSFEFNRMVERLRAYDAMNVQQLLVEKRKVEAIVESLSAPIIVVDEAGTIALANHAAAQLFRLDPALLRPGVRLDTLPLDSIVIEAITSVLANSGSAASNDDTRLLLRREEGIDRFFTFTVLPLATAGGLRGVVAVFSDITHFKELDRLKSDFLAKVSHELRTPLASMTMSVDLMREGLVGEINPRQRELLDSSKEDCRRLTKLIQELLELARIESRERPRALRPVEPGEAIAEALQAHQLPAREGGIDLRLDAAPNLPRINADVEELRWIVNNLVGNALRHTPSGGSITLTLRATSDELVLAVRDTGEGIPVDRQPRIFEKFHQVDEGRGSRAGSVGLGLAIVRDIVRLYEGTISLQSEPGHGATFTIRLPLAGIRSDIQTAS